MKKVRMNVSDIMNRNPRTVRESQTLAEAAQMLWVDDLGFLPVLDDQSQKLVGAITDRDMCMAGLMRGLPLHGIRVAEAMATKPITINDSEDISHAVRVLKENQLRPLPVVDSSKRVVGVVTLNDLARAEVMDGTPELGVMGALVNIARARKQPVKRASTVAAAPPR